MRPLPGRKPFDPTQPLRVRRVLESDQQFRIEWTRSAKVWDEP